MSLHTYLAFVAAAAVVLVIPGPTIMLVTSQAMTCGRRAVLPLAVGVMLGDLTAMTTSLLGLGAVLAASAALFQLFKWIGAIYLVYLGLRLWRTPVDPCGLPAAALPGGRSLLSGAFVVTALNPKGIAFFIAFLPQFVEAGRPLPAQLCLLGATFVVMAFVNAVVYGLFAGHLRDTLKSVGARRWFNRCGAAALVGAGLLTATVRRSA